MSDRVRVERDDHVAVVTIDRPDRMNALDPQAHRELSEAWQAFRADPDLWVAILTGAGDRAFCAGNDLKAVADAPAAGPRPVDHPGGFGGITRGFDCPKPIIAAVNGYALGGGLELVLACDVVVAADHARFGLPEARVGLVAGAGGIHRLVRRVPHNVAMGMIVTGRQIDAEEAHRIGLVNEVVPAADLQSTARRWAEEVVACSPIAVQLAKEAVSASLHLPAEAAIQADWDQGRMQRLFDAPDFREGPRAFAEKRPPEWRNPTS